MKIVVVGTGGVGAFFGGKLANAGHEVTFVARGEHKMAMESNGLRIKSFNGDFEVKPVKVIDKVSDAGKVDLVILAVKAWQVRDIAPLLTSVLLPSTVVLPLQNGVIINRELSEYIPAGHLLQGLCRIISMIESPGVIVHVGVEPTIIFGEPDNVKSYRVSELNKIFNASGFKAKVADDIQAELWKKYIAICASALLAVTRSTYGEVRSLPETRGMMRQLFVEIAELASRLGVVIEDEFVDKTMAFIDTFPYDSTSSLTRDIWEGKPSELEYQNGTVVKLAREVGLEVPVNEFIYNSLLLSEKRARSKS